MPFLPLHKTTFYSLPFLPHLPSLNAINGPRQIHPLRTRLSAAGAPTLELSCLSWRLAVETDNIINWEEVPRECEGYVRSYMLGGQYQLDLALVTKEAYLYAKTLALPNDDMNVWVFDIDETALSNIPYYANYEFGADPFNSTTFNEYTYKATTPPLQETLKLYKELIELGIKPVFISGRGTEQEEMTTENLKRSGYFHWRKLILKAEAYYEDNDMVYKTAARKQLEEEGFRIVGNIGDQWSDIMGTPSGNRTFKLPDPMYYIA